MAQLVGKTILYTGLAIGIVLGYIVIGVAYLIEAAQDTRDWITGRRL